MFSSSSHSYIQCTNLSTAQCELGFPLVITFSVPTFPLPSMSWVFPCYYIQCTNLFSAFSSCMSWVFPHYYIQCTNLFSALAFSSSMSWVFPSLLHSVYQPFLCLGFLLQYELDFPLVITFSVPTFSLPWPSPPVWLGFSSRYYIQCTNLFSALAFSPSMSWVFPALLHSVYQPFLCPGLLLQYELGFPLVITFSVPTFSLPSPPVWVGFSPRYNIQCTNLSTAQCELGFPLVITFSVPTFSLPSPPVWVGFSLVITFSVPTFSLPSPSVWVGFSLVITFSVPTFSLPSPSVWELGFPLVIPFSVPTFSLPWPSPPVWVGFSSRLLHSVYQPFLCPGFLLQYDLGFPLVITFSVPTFSLPSPPVWVGFSPRYYIQCTNLFSALAFSSSMSWVFPSLLHLVYQPFLCPGLLLQYELDFPLVITFSVPTFSLPWLSPPVWVGFSPCFFIQCTNLFSALAFSSSMSWVFPSLLHSVYQSFLCLLLQYELGFPLVITFSVPTFFLLSPPVWVGSSPCLYIQCTNLFSALAFSSSMSWVFLSLLHLVYQPFLCPGLLLQYELDFPLVITFSVPTFSLPWPSPPVWVGFSSRYYI